MSSKKILKYDALIIGSRPVALFTALKLEQQGKSVAVIEQTDEVGGLSKPLKSSEQLFCSSAPNLPNEQEILDGLNKFKEFLPSLSYEISEHGPITYKNSKVQPFLGFGTLDNPAVDAFDKILSTESIKLNLSESQMVEQLKAQSEAEYFLYSTITKMNIGEFAELTINADKQLQADEIYYFEDPKQLSNLLTTNNSTPTITKTTKQKLGKFKSFAAVNLIFQHTNPVTESPASHVIYGAKEVICVGQFYLSNGLPFSHWMTLTPTEFAQDSEHTGMLVKEIKKQVKRMFPDFEDSVEKDFIVIQDCSYGWLPDGVSKEHCLPKEERLKLSGRLLTDQWGPKGDFIPPL